MEKTVINMTFIGRFDTYRLMIKQAERKVGNTCLCHTKKRGDGLYFYDGWHWMLLAEIDNPFSLAENGKCVVIDKLRVTGKGWVLIIGEKPKGMAVGRKMRCNDSGFQFTISGFGGLSNITQKELILSPNSAVESQVHVGDVLQMINE